MALEDHLRLKLLIDGVFQIKVSNVEVQFMSNNQKVETLEGLAGKTPGSGEVRITGRVAVPVGGPEFDTFSAVVDGTYHDLQVPFGVKSYIGTGWFDDTGISQAVNAGTEQAFTWIGEFSKPQ